MRFGLSMRKHMPALFPDGNATAFPLWKYGKVRQIDATGLSLDSLGLMVLTKELPTGMYDPPFSLEGKTVLDIGAANGETAWWFLKKHRAERVICIECDEKRLHNLRRNQSALNIDIIPEPFRVEHLLKEKYDFIKCDIEGYEMRLIDYLDQGHKLKPCVLEAHTRWIMERFLEKGFHVTKTGFDDFASVGLYVMANYSDWKR